MVKLVLPHLFGAKILSCQKALFQLCLMATTILVTKELTSITTIKKISS